jgi:two-component system OmpR family sensor kinase
MSLRTRLLVSYLIVVATFMCIISLVLLLLATGLMRTIVYQRLNAAADASLALVLRPQVLAELPLERIAETRHVRVLFTDEEGTVLRDSGGSQPRWNVLDQADYEQSPRSLQGSWQDDQNQRWLFVGRRWAPPTDAATQRQGWIVFATPELNRRVWFSQNMLRPLLLAGVIGLMLSALLAWLVSRSIARPLQRVAEAAHAIAQGDYDQTVPASGPAEVRRLAQDFNRMGQQVRASRDAQRDFVANVSHELKTPLTSIQGYSQAILDGTAADPETIQRSAAIIHDESERLGRMVAELLDLSRIESRQTVMRREPVDLASLIGNIVERFRLRAEEAGITLAVQIAELPRVMGDGDRLAQVFTNLVDNALKHTPKGGKVAVTAKPLTPSGVQKLKQAWPRAVEVAVSDSGSGIPPEDLSRVFERFYQVDKSRKHTGSIGLGLAITREIIEAHGGSIKAESIVGLGTRFTLVLPVRAD